MLCGWRHGHSGSAFCHLYSYKLAHCPGKVGHIPQRLPCGKASAWSWPLQGYEDDQDRPRRTQLYLHNRKKIYPGHKNRTGLVYFIYNTKREKESNNFRETWICDCIGTWEIFAEGRQDLLHAWILTNSKHRLLSTEKWASQSKQREKK